MDLKLTKSDLLIFCVVLSVSFFLLGLMIDNLGSKVIEVTKEKLTPIYKVDTKEKKIAITLDGMWGAQYTPKL